LICLAEEVLDMRLSSTRKKAIVLVALLLLGGWGFAVAQDKIAELKFARPPARDSANVRAGRFAA
jgi:hypothetical protein